jgi:hypothetical protein
LKLLAAVGLALWLVGGASAEPLEVEIRPIDRFGAADASDGPLTFVGGLAVSSHDPAFGGFSGIDILPDGSVLIVGDTGFVLRARLEHDGGRLVGLAAAEIGTLFAGGAASKQRGDAEDIAIDPTDPSRGVLVRERQANALLAFDLVAGWPQDFEPRRVGADDRILRSNRGLESVAYAPPASPIAGNVVAVAERPPAGEEDIPGWIAGVGPFSIVRRDDYDISSARFLPDGDLLLLERRYSLLSGIAMRLRRVAASAVEVGARLEGESLLEAGMTSQIDNMEGLAVHRDGFGRTILTLVSDDNHNPLQRTLILQFALSED